MLNKILALTFTVLVLTGRISSYKPGQDGHSGTRLAGARCLNLPKKYWDWKPNYPVPVCAMRACCSSSCSPRMGDIALVRRKDWTHFCYVLDAGPYGCLDKSGKWHNCRPKGPYKGKLPKGWKWKSVIHVHAKKALRRQMILEAMK